MKTVFRIRALGALLVATFAGACAAEEATAPLAHLSAAALTHPAGVIVATTPLSLRPFGIAIAKETGVVMVTRGSANVVQKGLLPSTSLPTSIAVGVEPTNVTFNGSGSRAWVANQLSSSIGIIDVATGVQTGTIPLPVNPFNVTWVRSVGRVYVTNNGGYIYLINAGAGTLVDSIATGGVTNGITTDAAGARVYVSLVLGGIVLEIDPATRAITRSFATGGRPQDLAVNTARTRLFVADEFGGVQLWNLTTGVRVGTVALPGGPFGLALTPDEKQLYAGIPSLGSVAVVDLATRRVTATLATGGIPRKIAFNKAGTTAVIANEAGHVTYVN